MRSQGHLRAYLLLEKVFALLAAAAAGAQVPGPVPVVVAPVTERDVPPSTRLVGTIRPARVATVAAEVAGLVAAFDAEEGQFLKEGAIICKVDPTVARLRLEEAQAVLAGLQSTLTELENGERPEELKRLEGLVVEAEAGVKKWDFERRRIADLLARGQSSDKEVHDTEMEYQGASGRLAQAKAQLERARNGPRAEELARARKNVAAQQAVVARLERDLRRTEVRAPFEGAVIARRTEVGEWIDAGGAVCQMIAMGTVKVRVDVPESVIQYARVGELVTVEVEALGTTRTAKIARVIPQATAAARTFPVEIDLPNADHSLLPGMFVWAHVPSGPAGKRLMVNKDAIVAQGTSKQVFVIRPGEGGVQMAIPLPVTTGMELVGEVEVRAEGLAPGDLAVCRANERLFGPTPVIPRPLATSQPAGSPEGNPAEPRPRQGEE